MINGLQNTIFINTYTVKMDGGGNNKKYRMSEVQVERNICFNIFTFYSGVKMLSRFHKS